MKAFFLSAERHSDELGRVQRTLQKCFWSSGEFWGHIFYKISSSLIQCELWFLLRTQVHCTRVTTTQACWGCHKENRMPVKDWFEGKVEVYKCICLARQRQPSLSQRSFFLFYLQQLLLTISCPGDCPSITRSTPAVPPFSWSSYSKRKQKQKEPGRTGRP